MATTRGRSRTKRPVSASRSSSKSKPQKKTARSSGDVFVYVPQWIGYTRVLCTLLSLYLASTSLTTGTQYIPSIVLYLLSFIGDLFDGMAARRFDQSSKFGGVLDMVTDRCTTAGMLVVLTWLYPSERLVFLGLLLLDVSSHWVQMTSALLLGAHHKSTEGNATKFFLVRWFYGSYPFFGFCCVGAELTYVLLYVLIYVPSGTVRVALEAMLNVCKVACVCKNVVNVAQLCSASNDIANKDAEEWNKANKA